MSRRQPASINLRDLCKTYYLEDGDANGAMLLRMLTGWTIPARTRKVAALDNVSFNISEGERVGIIGRNGAGKTTLLSILAGISSPTSGTVTVQGDVHAMLTIGAVLRDELSGRENIRLDRAVHGLSGREIDMRIDEIVAFAELGEFIDRPVRTYSSGMKARLAFAMGAFVSPDILILDETLSVGDAFFASKATARMRSIAAEGRIVIVVSHGLSNIVEMCTRCLWLDNGRVVMDGDPALVTAAYEASVSRSDEKELALKFTTDERLVPVRNPESIESVTVHQSGETVSSIAHPFLPLTLTIKGCTPADVEMQSDLELVIRRVDGRLITRQRLSEADAYLVSATPFGVRIDLDPMILGADLYRFEVSLLSGQNVLARLARVIEVVDEEGQSGGRPLLYLPPEITVRPVEELPR